MNLVLERMEKINHILKVIGVYTGGIATVLMMVIIVLDVFFRNFFNSPISGTYEVVQYYLMPLVVFPALAYTYSSGILPRLSELIEKSPKAFRNFMAYLILVIELVIFTLLAVYGWKFAMAGVGDQMAVAVGGTLTPVYPVYFLIPLGFALVVTEVLLAGIKRIKSAT